MTELWQQFIAITAERLVQGGIDPAECRLEARLIVAHALGLSREQTILRREAPTDSEEARVEALLVRRLRREPLAYILGTRWFYGLEFAVGPGVLVPRPETELLVEWALEHLPRDAASRIADVGTGSGCIAVAIARQRPSVVVDAIDISPDALRIAKANAERHGVSDRIRFHKGDLFHAVPGAALYDAVVSNPPYIPRSESPRLAPEVADHEPHTALFGPDPDGLGLYRRLAIETASHLRPDGGLAVEVGAGQAPDVATLLQNAGWMRVARIPDLAGIERVVTAVAPNLQGVPGQANQAAHDNSPRNENKESE